MDINQQLQPVVAGLIEGIKASIESELREQITQEVIQKIASAELNNIVESLISTRLAERIAEFNIESITKQQLDIAVNKLTNQLDKTLTTTATQQITTVINNRIAGFDLNLVVNEIVKSKIEDIALNQSFPEKSIPHSSIDMRGLNLTGDQVKGGIIEQFGSTGIEDRASTIRMTLMDHAVVFEGPVWTPELKVKGSATIDGDLTLAGTLHGPTIDVLVTKSTESVLNSLNTDLFAGFSNLVHKQIKEDGLDLDKITQAGRDVVKGPQLGYHITDSNLQRVGILRDLQTSGENLLSDTLYVTGRRVGVNTIDPSATFVVWDEEVELIVAKQSQDTGYIGTPRRQPLVLGSNSKNNIRLEVDGSVQIDHLTVGKMSMSSAATVPNYSGTPGQIVWNEQPSLGGPMGWVCLGSTRWANFGIID